jgi:predicted transposase YbfD/YdcC
VLDVVFHDDLARKRTADGRQNMAVIKHMNVNLIRNRKDKKTRQPEPRLP